MCMLLQLEEHPKPGALAQNPVLAVGHFHHVKLHHGLTQGT